MAHHKNTLARSPRDLLDEVRLLQKTAAEDGAAWVIRHNIQDIWERLHLISQNGDVPRQPLVELIRTMEAEHHFVKLIKGDRQAELDEARFCGEYLAALNLAIGWLESQVKAGIPNELPAGYFADVALPLLAVVKKPEEIPARESEPVVESPDGVSHEESVKADQAFSLHPIEFQPFARSESIPTAVKNDEQLKADAASASRSQGAIAPTEFCQLGDPPSESAVHVSRNQVSDITGLEPSSLDKYIKQWGTCKPSLIQGRWVDTYPLSIVGPWLVRKKMLELLPDVIPPHKPRADKRLRRTKKN